MTTTSSKTRYIFWRFNSLGIWSLFQVEANEWGRQHFVHNCHATDTSAPARSNFETELAKKLIFKEKYWQASYRLFLHKWKAKNKAGNLNWLLESLVKKDLWSNTCYAGLALLVAKVNKDLKWVFLCSYLYAGRKETLQGLQMLSSVSLKCHVPMIVINWSIFWNFKIIKRSQVMLLSFDLCHYPSDQMSQRSQVSRITLWGRGCL